MSFCPFSVVVFSTAGFPFFCCRWLSEADISPGCVYMLQLERKVKEQEAKIKSLEVIRHFRQHCVHIQTIDYTIFAFLAQPVGILWGRLPS